LPLSRISAGPDGQSVDTTGTPKDNASTITWKTYQDIQTNPDIAWIVPISLGDSHRGFRVMGTVPEYFAHYHYRRGQPLTFGTHSA
ncbi:hypothetical protein JDN40_00125, partial [Rhodomicrobium vannielii ATCC 17100]|nr:hypothetical protein [Rhodomicrobium vannielii ATCC 17100]